MSLALKKKIVRQVIADLEKDLDVLQLSALTAREAATHEESKAEDKYDTRGLEASYLAGAQAKRAGEIRDFIATLRQVEVSDFGKDSSVAITALVEIENDDGKNLVFLLPKGGGRVVEMDGRRVQVITPVSPMGAELMGREIGDEFSFVSAGTRREYVVASIS